MGEHNGIWFYTIGQRHGIKVGGTKKPYFVVEKDLDASVIYVVEGREHPALWKKKMIIEDFHVIEPDYKWQREGYTATIRYRSQDKSIKLTAEGKKVLIEFQEPQWAPALGQSLVVFNQRECIGGGILTEIL